MKVSVVGSEGYIGRALCWQLEEDGHEIQRIDAVVYNQPFYQDICYAFKQRTIAEALHKFTPEVVVWLAAYAHDPENKITRPQFFRNNALRAQAALSYKWRSIFISSLSVFTMSHYAASKRHLENLIAQSPFWYQKCQILRFGTIYGPVHKDDLSTFRPHLLLNKMMMDAVRFQKITIPPSSIYRAVLSLDRAVNVMRAAITAWPEPKGCITNHYDVACDLNSFAHIILNYVPETKIVVQSTSGPPISYGQNWVCNRKVKLTELHEFCVKYKNHEWRDRFNALYEFVAKHDSESVEAQL